MIGDGGEYSYILRDSSYKQLIWKESNQAKRAYVNIPPPIIDVPASLIMILHEFNEQQISCFVIYFYIRLLE